MPNDTSKLTILMHYRHFPVAMGRFFADGFRQLGHKVVGIGPHSDTIPWPGDPSYPQYSNPPAIQVPDEPMSVRKAVELANATGESIDFVVQASDTNWLTGESPVPNFVIGTDPHVLDYHERLDHADFFFSMQNNYMQDYPGPYRTWLPYAYDPDIHYPEAVDRLYDVVCIGQQYGERHKALEAMKEAGLRVYEKIGDMYDESRLRYSQGLIAFNLSSKLDLPARFWEGLAYRKLVITNRLPDLTDVLHKYGIKEGIHYLAYDTIAEAVELAKYYTEHEDEAIAIAYAGHEAVKANTYQTRCKQILEVYHAITG